MPVCRVRDHFRRLSVAFQATGFQPVVVDLEERTRETQILTALQAIDRIAEIRASLHQRQGTYPGDPQAEVRAEWEEDIERVWRGEA